MRRRRLPGWALLVPIGVAVGVVAGWQFGGLAHPLWALGFFGTGALLGTGLAVVHPRSRPDVRALALVLVLGTVVSVSVGEVRTHTGTGYGGYHALVGDDGKQLERHRPWGSTCTQTVIRFNATVPTWARTEVVDVVLDAAERKVPVTFSNGQPTPVAAGSHVVEISFDAIAAPRTPAGPRRYALRYVAADRHLVSLAVVLFGRNVAHKEDVVRKAARGLIAEASGLAITANAEGTGISKHLYTSADSFSAKDIEVMRSFAGCA
jgi:hypothetical protein